MRSRSDGAANLLVLLAIFLVGRTAGGQEVLWSVPSPEPAGFAQVMGVAGDVDGDGTEDVAVLTGTNIFSPPISQKVTVLRGSDGGVLWSIIPFASAYLTFTAMGDVDGDALSDVALGEPGYYQGMMLGIGRVRVLSGSGGAVIYELVGSQFGGLLGSGLESIPDIDGDGVRELVATTPYEYAAGLGFGFGVTRVYSGSVLTAGSVLWAQMYMPLTNPFGPLPPGVYPTSYSVGRLADVSGDGYSDLVIGGLDTMRVVSGIDGTLLYGFSTVFFSGGPYAFLPTPPLYGLRFEGDLNGDGVADIVGGRATAVNLSLASFGPGVLAARSGLDGSPLWWQVSPGGAMDGLGIGYGGGEDWDGDGLADVVVGAPGAAGGTGRIEVRSGLDGSMKFSLGLLPSAGPVGFGVSLSVLEDSNGDGLREVAVAAPYTTVTGVANTGVIHLCTLCAVFGPSCPGSIPTAPRMRCAGGQAAVGNASYEVRLDDAPPSALAVLLLGASDTTWGVTSLPAPLPGSPGCFVLVSGDVILSPPSGATSTMGTASISLPIPNDPSLAGAVAFSQWIVVDAGLPGFLSSKGLRISIVP